MTRNNYDNIAPIYDSLANLVFGRSISMAKTHFLPNLAKKGNILLIGGGSGQLLKPLLEQCDETTIYFVEASIGMINQAIPKIPTHLKDRVKIIHGNENTILEEIMFNSIITNFFLDQFTKSYLEFLIPFLNDKLLPEGKWIYTDFVLKKENKHHWWQRVLVGLMHLFFKITTRLENRRLIELGPFFNKQQLYCLQEEKFYYDLIATRVYARQ